jgi:hypothetical protein
MKVDTTNLMSRSGNNATFSYVRCAFLRHKEVQSERTKSQHDCDVLQIYKDMNPAIWQSARPLFFIMQIIFANICISSPRAADGLRPI